METVRPKAGLLAALASGLALAASSMSSMQQATEGASASLRGFGKKFAKKHRNAKATTWTDRVGMPHGASGDKLRRQVMRGTLGLIGGRRGPLDTWSSTKVARLGLGDRRRKSA